MQSVGLPKNRSAFVAAWLTAAALGITALTGEVGWIGGIHSDIPGQAKALPVPTSILADADGNVLWMDQSENYQRRSDPDHVLGALRAHLN